MPGGPQRVWEASRGSQSVETDLGKEFRGLSRVFRRFNCVLGRFITIYYRFKEGLIVEKSVLRVNISILTRKE